MKALSSPDARRFILGITGPPAAGKSTLAGRLVNAINSAAGSTVAAAVPMDGFHLDNVTLQRLGLTHKKGAPETFNSVAFLQLLRHIREVPRRGLSAPAYDRSLHDPQPDAIGISKDVKIIVTEGNYLLLNAGQWSLIRGQLDEVWYVNASLGIIRRRLLERHLMNGLSMEEARNKIEGSDVPNAILVQQTVDSADLLIDDIGETVSSPPSPSTCSEVIGIGASTVDIVTLVDHYPAGREVQRAIDLTVQGGGPVSTAMVTLARLGAKSAMIDLLGDDWRAAIIRDEYRREGVCQRRVGTVPGGVSATSTILVQKGNADRAIMYFPGSGHELSELDFDEALIDGSSILHMNGRHLKFCMSACACAQRTRVKTSFDGGAGRYSPALRELVRMIDICIVARDFAEKYTGESRVRAMAESLLGEGPELVVITDGANGSWIHHREQVPFEQPAFLSGETIDTTGCGDSYHGGFLYGLLRGMTLRRSAALASAVASLNSRHLGGRTGLPDLRTVEEFLSNQTEV